QAEDGIRDLIVTGVQTCALPIWESVRESRGDPVRPGPADQQDVVRFQVVVGDVGIRLDGDVVVPPSACDAVLKDRRGLLLRARKIGRASCRDRGEVWGGVWVGRW